MNLLRKNGMLHSSARAAQIATSAATSHIVAVDDCLATLRRIPSQSIQLVICDPPYNINVAAWESARALGQAFRSPEFQARAGRYPDSTAAAPHVFTKIAVPGICAT